MIASGSRALSASFVFLHFFANQFKRYYNPRPWGRKKLRIQWNGALRAQLFGNGLDWRTPSRLFCFAEQRRDCKKWVCKSGQWRLLFFHKKLKNHQQICEKKISTFLWFSEITTMICAEKTTFFIKNWRTTKRSAKRKKVSFCDFQKSPLWSVPKKRLFPFFFAERSRDCKKWAPKSGQWQL